MVSTGGAGPPVGGVQGGPPTNFSHANAVSFEEHFAANMVTGGGC